MSFELPFDIFLAIFSHLSVYDVLRVRQACRTFQELSQLRSLWHGLFNKHVLEQNVPVPGLGSQSVGDLTAAELESYTFHALRLRRTWSSVNPSHSRQLELPSNIFGCRVISLHFLSTTGSSNYLLSVLLTHHDGQRLFTVQCWDIQASPPKCIAVRTFTRFKGLVVNQNPTKFGVLAINSSNVEIFDIDCTISDPRNAFVVTSQFPEVVEGIHLFSGSRLLTRDGIGRTHIWDIEYPEVKVEIRNPHNIQFEVILAAYIDDTRLIVIRTTELEVYTLPRSVTQVPASSVPPSGLILDPILYHKWPWRIDSVVLSPQHSWSRAGTKNRATLNILLRFGSLFPWPINILHHFELRPNEFYSATHDQEELEILPYHFPPIMRQTIASPVRLFATSDIALGTFGTAVWIDSHTEDHFGHSDRGQRLAGKYFPLVTEDDEEPVDTTTVAASLYALDEDDGWTRVALDEEEGKIAVGCVDGRILIYDYT